MLCARSIKQLERGHPGCGGRASSAIALEKLKSEYIIDSVMLTVAFCPAGKIMVPSHVGRIPIMSCGNRTIILASAGSL
jgi:hypothetical protein